MRVGLACCAKRAQSEDRDEPVHGARSLDCKGHRAPVAHRIERSAPDRKAAGSIPAGRTSVLTLVVRFPHVWFQPCRINDWQAHVWRQRCQIQPTGPRLARQLPDRVARAHDARDHHLAVGSSQPELAPDRRVDEPQRIVAETGRELCAARVRLLAELDHGRTDLNPAAGGQVREADVEIHIELVAREGPTLAFARDRSRRAGVHQRQLRLRIRASIGCVSASTWTPGIALEAVVKAQPRLSENLALVLCRAPGDQLNRSAVRGRIAYVVEALLEPGQFVCIAHTGILRSWTSQASGNSRWRFRMPSNRTISATRRFGFAAGSSPPRLTKPI